MKKFIIIFTGIYFAIGFSFAMMVYVGELKTFQCVQPSAPNDYFTIGTGSFVNPDLAQCTRRGATMQYIQNIPLLTVFGVPIVVARFAHGLFR